VVTAVNADGESGDSAWVMAAPRAKAPRPGLARIPAGAFRMGDSLDGTSYALPAHTVDLDEFWIDRYETTYALWKKVYDWAVMHGYAFDNPGQNGSTRQGDFLPVVMVSWYDAAKWLNARSEKEGRTPVYYADNALSAVFRTGNIDLTAAQHLKCFGRMFRKPTYTAPYFGFRSASRKH
jgi:formylglycine-generating enzyme required for sulfatase activity